MKLKDTCSLEESYDKLDSVLKNRDITLWTKVRLVKAMVFPRHVQTWELDHNECRVLKNWCFWIVVLGKAFKSPLDNKEVKSVSPKGNQPWIFSGSSDAKTEVPILWPPDEKSWLIGKDPDAGKDWAQEEKRATEDEMFGWHHWLNGHEFDKLWKIVKDRGAWRATVHGITKSWTWLRDWTTAKECLENYCSIYFVWIFH